MLPLDGLCTSFPTDPQQAALAYAQSGSLVAFIRERYGGEGLQRLIAAYRDTTDCEAGVLSALGISLSSLQAEWKMSLPQHRDLFKLVQANGAWLGLWLGGCLIVLLALPFLPRRRKNTKGNEQQQEVPKPNR